jgi:hypothetical protein
VDVCDSVRHERKGIAVVVVPHVEAERTCLSRYRQISSLADQGKGDNNTQLVVRSPALISFEKSVQEQRVVSL